jgi:hypothetical protein
MSQVVRGTAAPLCVNEVLDKKWQLFLYNTWEGYMLIINSPFNIKRVRYWWCGKKKSNLWYYHICGPIQKFYVWFIVITPDDNTWYSWMFTYISSTHCEITSAVYTLLHPCGKQLLYSYLHRWCKETVTAMFIASCDSNFWAHRCSYTQANNR